MAEHHLNEALVHWTAYANLRNGNYVPALYNRVGYVDLTAKTERVAADIALAGNLKPGTVIREAPRSGTERGVRNRPLRISGT